MDSSLPHSFWEPRLSPWSSGMWIYQLSGCKWSSPTESKDVWVPEYTLPGKSEKWPDSHREVNPIQQPQASQLNVCYLWHLRGAQLLCAGGMRATQVQLWTDPPENTVPKKSTKAMISKLRINKDCGSWLKWRFPGLISWRGIWCAFFLHDHSKRFPKPRPWNLFGDTLKLLNKSCTWSVAALPEVSRTAVYKTGRTTDSQWRGEH